MERDHTTEPAAAPQNGLTPYYADEWTTLYRGKESEVLPHLSSVAPFDLVVTSPPYNLGTPSGRGFGHYSGSASIGQRGGGQHFGNLDDGYDDHDDAMPHEEYVAWQHAVLRSAWTLLADDGAIFYNHKPRVGGERVLLPVDLIPSELPLRQVIVWDRGSGFNRTFAYYVPAHEWIMLIAKPSWRSITKSVDDVWRVPFETRNAHPAPFPVAIPERCIATTGAKSVLDPFAGSGSTLVAAKRVGVRSVGIEMSERYCEMAATRLAATPVSMFSGPATVEQEAMFA